MSEVNENGKTLDYDCISKSRLIRQILQIDDVTFSPSALDRILTLIQNQVPYDEPDPRYVDERRQNHDS